MSKELEMFEKLCATYIANHNYFITDGDARLLLSIKVLLENYDNQDERQDELNEFRSVISENFNVKDGEETPEKLNEILDDFIKTIEKQAKILDILKKKCVIQLFTDEQWEQLGYKMLVGGNLVIDLTQEEYDLLKEWLNGTK